MNEHQARALSTGGWGEVADQDMANRYLRRIADGRRRRLCRCGEHVTHLEMINGMALGASCELCARRWVKFR